MILVRSLDSEEFEVVEVGEVMEKKPKKLV